MRRFNAISVAANIDRIIKNEDHRSINIHSIFNNCINLEMGNRFISILSNKNNTCPFGIRLGNEEFRELYNYLYYDTQVTIQQDNIYFNDLYMITLDIPKAHIKYENTNEVKILDFKTNLQYLSEVILDNKWESGFDYKTEEIIFYLNYDEVNEELSEFIENIELIKDIKKNTDYNYYKFINFFVGRGKGLTPSGDDMLIGMMAMFSIANYELEIFKRNLDIYLKNIAEDRTTRISFEYLFYANQNLFISCLEDLCYSILYLDEDEVLRNMVKLKEFGSTSSIDTVIGIFLASKIILDSKK